MKRLFWPIAMLLVVMLSVPLEGQIIASKEAFPMGWITATAPSLTGVLQCANYSRHEWRVERSDGITVYDSAVKEPTGAALPPGFARTKEMRGRTVVQKLGNGWLVGFNAGEFGGGLWWSDESGHAKKLTDENVRALIPRSEAVLVFTGLAHLGVDEGKIYSFGRNGHSELSLIADIGSEPSAAVMGDAETVLIATHVGVARLTTANKVEYLYRNRAMESLYPNSLVEDAGGNVVVGMRFYVLRLERNSTGYQDVWYIPTACRKTRVKEYVDCECIGKP
jgi:hypothetical protein